MGELESIRTEINSGSLNHKAFFDEIENVLRTYFANELDLLTLPGNLNELEQDRLLASLPDSHKEHFLNLNQMIEEAKFAGRVFTQEDCLVATDEAASIIKSLEELN